jgi:hypothetical protein
LFEVLLPFAVPNDFTFYHVDDLFGNVGGMVCDPLKVPGNQEKVNQITHAIGLLDDSILYLGMDLAVDTIHLII